MPLLVSFRGRPVKHRRRALEGMRLIFVNPMRGQPGEVAIVTQEDWLCHSRIEFFPSQQMPDLRALAAQFEHRSL